MTRCPLCRAVSSKTGDHLEGENRLEGPELVDHIEPSLVGATSHSAAASALLPGQLGAGGRQPCPADGHQQGDPAATQEQQ